MLLGQQFTARNGIKNRVAQRDRERICGAEGLSQKSSQEIARGEEGMGDTGKEKQRSR